MADRAGNGVSIERIGGRSIVSLRVARSSLDPACDRLQLAPANRASGTNPRSLWLGPDRWLLVSDSLAPDAMIDSCSQALGGMLYNAVDHSAGLAVVRVAGPEASQLLATGTGIDLRSRNFPVDSCARTRLAQIAAVIVAEVPGIYDVYVDRSFETYLTDWLAESSRVYLSYRT